MIELEGNIWDHASQFQPIVITTNGITRADGRAVMGRGIAAEAAKRYPDLPGWLATSLQIDGNHVALIRIPPAVIVTMPTKHHWADKSDPALIVRSAHELVALTDRMAWEYVVMPRPGCGNGGLRWADVRALLAPILDRRFAVFTLPEARKG